jgi:hypothetical protein
VYQTIPAPELAGRGGMPRPCENSGKRSHHKHLRVASASGDLAGALKARRSGGCAAGHVSSAYHLAAELRPGKHTLVSRVVDSSAAGARVSKDLVRPRPLERRHGHIARSRSVGTGISLPVRWILVNVPYIVPTL